jgi:hypothetical protein
VTFSGEMLDTDASWPVEPRPLAFTLCGVKCGVKIVHSLAETLDFGVTVVLPLQLDPRIQARRRCAEGQPCSIDPACDQTTASSETRPSGSASTDGNHPIVPLPIITSTNRSV